jgi:hypothetical protein
MLLFRDGTVFRIVVYVGSCSLLRDKSKFQSANVAC